MEIKDVIEEIERDITNAKNNGNQTIDIDSLLKYLINIKNNTVADLEAEREEKRFANEMRLEEYKASIQLRLADLANTTQSSSDMLNSLLETSRSALKCALIINCGTAIAILVFIDTVWSILFDKYTMSSLILSISYFSCGALCSLIGSALRFLSQNYYIQYFHEQVKAIQENFNTNTAATFSDKAMIKGNRLCNFAIIIAASSYIFFIIGVVSVGIAFYNHFSSIVLP
jgi:hypothetical protein